MMKRVKKVADKGRGKKAHGLLDEVLGKALNQSSILMATDPDNSRIFTNPRKVNIIGHKDSAMEAFISRDGRLLYFHKEKAGRFNIYVLERNAN